MATRSQSKTVVSTKGQVILPKAIRDALNWDAGTTLEVEPGANSVTLRAERVFKPTEPGAARGILDGRGKKVTLADFDKAITEEVMRRHARGRY